MKKPTKFKQVLELLPDNDPDKLTYQKLIEAGITGHALYYLMLVMITKVLNEGWMPNYNDTNQRKYELWYSVEADDKHPSGSGLSFTYYVTWSSFTTVGSRLLFRDYETGLYAFKHFKTEITNYILIKD
jgi:hypothetical protein